MIERKKEIYIGYFFICNFYKIYKKKLNFEKTTINLGRLSRFSNMYLVLMLNKRK